MGEKALQHPCPQTRSSTPTGRTRRRKIGPLGCNFRWLREREGVLESHRRAGEDAGARDLHKRCYASRGVDFEDAPQTECNLYTHEVAVRVTVLEIGGRRLGVWRSSDDADSYKSTTAWNGELPASSAHPVVQQRGPSNSWASDRWMACDVTDKSPWARANTGSKAGTRVAPTRAKSGL